MTDKANSKIEIKVGSIVFSAEGEPGWLSTQLEKVLSAANAAGAIKSEQDIGRVGGGAALEVPKFSASLASHIKQMGADKKQVRRFLATADWLRQRGRGQMSTSEIAKALLDNQQNRLANPADCLNQNVARGFCEKTGKEFFITPEGLKELGYSE